MNVELDILISAIFVIAIALSGLPGLWQRTCTEFEITTRPSPVARLTRWLRNRLALERNFYRYWLRERQSRSQAWEAAQKVIG